MKVFDEAHKLKEEKMPCPNCKVMHSRQLLTVCENCKTPLKMFVPFFFVQAPPYGWKWQVANA